MSLALLNGNIHWFYATWGASAVVGAGSLPITWTRAVNNRFETRKGLALGLSLLGTGLLGFLIKPLTAWLIVHVGWRAAYVIIGLLPILIAFQVAMWAFHDVGGRQTHVERRALAAQRAARTPGLTFAQTLRDWRFWLLGTAFLPISFAVGGPIPNMENILRTSGFTAADVVSLTQLIGLSVVAGRTLGGWLIDRFWAPGAALFLFAASAFGCWALSRGQLSFGGAATAISLLGFAAGVEYDLMAFLVARYLGMKSYGAIYGSLYGFFALGAGVGPVVFGRAYDRTHSYEDILKLSAALFVLGACLLLALGRYRRFSVDGRTIIQRPVDL